MTALIAVETNKDLGSTIGAAEASAVVQLVILSNVMWILTVNITKASILLQYLRFFSDRNIRIACYILLSALMPAVCWGTVAGILLCSPVQKLWEPRVPGHCMSARTYWSSVAGVDFVLDFSILIIPMHDFITLHLPRKQRLCLLILYLLGFSVCLASAARLGGVLIANDEKQYQHSGVLAIIWSAVEANVGIICASLLSLKPLLLRMFPSIGQETGPARYSMQIRQISTDNTSHGENSRMFASMLTHKRITSTSSSEPSTDRNGASMDTGQPEYPQPCLGYGRSIFDMLQEDRMELARYV